MKPIDFRNETWNSIQNRIAGNRAAVLEAWTKHGPCTTEQLADRSGLELLSVRPRTTELLQLGFLRLAEVQATNTEGTYRASTQPEHARWLADQIAAARGIQLALPLP